MVIVVPAAVMSSLPVKVVAAARSSRLPPLNVSVVAEVPKAPATLAISLLPPLRSIPTEPLLAPPNEKSPPARVSLLVPSASAPVTVIAVEDWLVHA